MANATENLLMTRGDGRTAEGFIRPGKGGALSLPLASVVFSASKTLSNGQTLSIAKTLDDGITLLDQDDPAKVPYEIEFDPEDTAAFPASKVELNYTLRITENNGRPSTVLGGVLTVTPT